MFTKNLLAACYLFSLASAAALRADETVVRFHTSLGDIDVQLDSTNAPKTVANFLGYVNRGDYNDSIFHRSVPGFIIQGGGYYVAAGQVQLITAQPAVVNEYKDSNVRGTIALAKTSDDPNSGTDEWFFNLADNSSNLNNQNGGFTVFGNIIDSQGLAVMDAIAALEVVNAGTPFDQLPVVDYTDGQTVTVNNLVYVNSITVQPAPEFFSGETALSDGVYYLAFPSGHYFGYYSYLTDPHYIYHFDLGYEYVFDANDGKDGVYLYDFKSKTFFYTSPTFPFPYLYDFTLKTVLYYYPDPNQRRPLQYEPACATSTTSPPARSSRNKPIPPLRIAVFPPTWKCWRRVH